MNILASYNWIKDYLKTDLSADEFAKLTTYAGNSVEHSDQLSERFDKVVIGEVKKLKKHPNADKLKIAETKISKTKTVDIVCGGVNLAEGQRVAVALPGAKVYWHGESEMIELDEIEIRGSKSHGMIAAACELGFPKYPQEDHEIWDLSEICDAPVGTPFVKAMDLDDVIYDIEVTTNRPDCKSIIGQAREGAAITGDKFTWTPSKLASSKKTSSKLKISVKEKDICPKYEAIVLDGIKVGPSPWWLQKRLLLAGHRPINNVVDVTNYVLHEYGQPLHAFDADTLASDEIVVRKAKKGETIKALDEQDYKLDDSMLVIADAKKPVAIAGVMGGMETGTTEKTTKIVIESATFDPLSVRKTSRALSLFSDSSTLFGKGLSTESTTPALARAVELMQEVAGGEVISNLLTEQAKDYKSIEFNFDPKKTAELIGVDIAEKDMTKTLEALGFELKKKGSIYQTTVPYWRDHDIEHSRDFVEEVARIYGYENVPSVLPPGSMVEIEKEPVIVWERRIKEYLAGAGLSEVYGSAFVSESQLSKYGIKGDDAVLIENPLSSEETHLRPSLIPTMLSTIEANQARFPENALFEVAPVYLPRKNDIPDQPLRLVIAVHGKDGYKNFIHAKGILERLMGQSGIDKLRFERDGQDAGWHPGRSAKFWTGDHEQIGVIGEVSARMLNNFDIEGRITLIEIDFQTMIKHCTNTRAYQPIPIYPDVKRDLAFVVNSNVEYRDISEQIHKASGLIEELELFDIYQGKGIEKGKKSLAIHLAFRDAHRTLEAQDVDQELKKVESVLKKQFNAIIRE